MTPRIVFMGMTSEFSRPPFAALVEHGCPPVALLLPRPTATHGGLQTLPVSPLLSRADLIPLTPTLPQRAAAHGIPVYTVGSLRDPAALAALRGLRPDLIMVACFPRLLPQSWLDAPTLGGLNLHPSLLPAYRGPTPLREQLSAREQHTGVTLHWMDTGADTGDIVAQARVPFPTGITEPEAERLTASAGAKLLLDALARYPNIPRTPQEDWERETEGGGAKAG